jgi:hypothetical protein
MMLVPLVGKAISNKTIANANKTSATWVKGESCLNSSSQCVSYPSLSFYLCFRYTVANRLVPSAYQEDLHDYHISHCNAYEKNSSFSLRKGRACRAKSRVWRANADAICLN